MKLLLIGLGNIGSAYAYTRHNIGFLSLEYLAKQHNVSFQVDRLVTLASFTYQGRNIYMIRPTTYMNESGKAVRYWIKHLQLLLQDSLVIVDDLHLPFGTIKLRTKGSHGGHNGLRNIETYLGSSVYPRLRIGIGNHFHPGHQAKYVLEPFSKLEQATLPLHLKRACDIILSWCTIGITYTMAKYNNQNASHKE